MGEMMSFPKTFKKFIEYYQFIDKKEIYTNGSELIQSFRVMQAWNHYMDSFREAYEESDNDMNMFGYYCQNILRNMEELK